MAIVKHSDRTVRRACRTCGRKDLYWGHNTDDAIGVETCDKCGVTGKFVHLEKDGTRHGCNSGDKPEQADDIVPGETETDPSEAPKPAAPVSAVADPRAAALSALMDALAGPPVSPEMVRDIVKDELGSVIFPTQTVVIRPDSETRKIEGATHPKLAAVITNIGAGEHVLMVGPAGTGKSTIAEQAAEALGLEFYAISLSPQTPTSQLVGYMQATGDYVSTLFRQAYEHGGVFHFDEFDNGHPSILATVNAALANGRMAFPDQMVKRHPDFRAVASANTYGRGADRMYVGRQALDMATLDRFAIEYIDVDEALEDTLARGTGLPEHTVRQVLKYTRKLRDNAAKHKMAVVISPRASIGMCRLLHAGRAWGEVVDARARRGLSDADWTKLSAGAPAVSV